MSPLLPQNDIKILKDNIFAPENGTGENQQKINGVSTNI